MAESKGETVSSGGPAEQIALALEDDFSSLEFTSSAPDGQRQSAEKLLLDGQDRREIFAAEAFPTIGRIRSKVKTSKGVGVFVGTGTLVGGTQVVTCAHNVVHVTNIGSRSIVSWCKSMQFELQGKVYRVMSHEVHPKYVESKGDASYDYATLWLEKEPRVEDPKACPHPLCQPVSGMRIHIVGYPGEIRENVLKGMGGHLAEVDERVVMYGDIDTTAGQSGSPVFAWAHGKRHLLGVHVFGSSERNAACVLPDYVKEDFGNGEELLPGSTLITAHEHHATLRHFVSLGTGRPELVWKGHGNHFKDCAPQEAAGSRLLLRASRDGWSAADFHRLCDNQGPTLVVVKAVTGHIFGGFAAVSWQHREGTAWSESHKSCFLFSLHSNDERVPAPVFMPRKPYRSGGISACSFTGAVFGRDELCVPYHHAPEGVHQAQVNVGDDYEMPRGIFLSQFITGLDEHKLRVDIEEYEVWALDL